MQETLLSTFFMWGYREIITPVFEYLDTIAPGLSKGLLEKSYKFVDRESGKLILLRPDITPQVARMLAGVFSEELKPLRLCYYGNVFRYEESHGGKEKEIFQAGCELAGTLSPDADAEIIALAAEALRKCEINEFKIVLGQVGYLEGLISSLKDILGNSVSREWEDSLRDAISKKDVDRIYAILTQSCVKEEIREGILNIPNLFGGEKVFEQALKISDNEESRKAIENLKDIYSILCYYNLEDRILIDLCDIRGVNYYTGLFFEIFLPEVAYPVARGGRYDRLVGKFGKDIPSVGFAFDIEGIITAKEAREEHFIDYPIKYMIVGEEEYSREAIRLASYLREKGNRVIIDLSKDDMDVSMRYARNNNIEKLIIIKGKKEPLILVDARKGDMVQIKKERL